MLIYIVRRIIGSLVALLIITTVVFFVLRLTGNPVVEQLKHLGASQEHIRAVEQALGYLKPLPVQYFRYVTQVASGNLGNSVDYGSSNWSLIAQRMPYTLQLVGASLALTLLIAVPLGILAGSRRRGLADRLVIPFSTLGQSVPSFVIGTLLILIFAVWVEWVPASGAAGPFSIVLPAVTLAVYPISQIARVLRGSMVEVGVAAYVMTARAKGVREWIVVLRHIFRNALLPMITIVSVQFAYMLGGSIVVESVFGRPGIGSMTVYALSTNDFPLATAVVIVLSVMVIGVNLLTDILYTIADPRIQHI